MKARALLLLAWCWPAAGLAQTVYWEFHAGSEVHSAEPLSDGRVLISDKDHNRLIEVVPDYPEGGAIVWQVGGLYLPDRTRRLPNGNTLVADTLNNRALEIDPSGQTVWSFGTPGNISCDDSSCVAPGDADRLANGDTLVGGEDQHRLMRVDASGNKLWQYGDANCARGAGPNQLNTPFSFYGLPNGDVLVTDIDNARVIQIRPQLPVGGTIVWQYGNLVYGAGPNQLNYPVRAVPLSNGHVLISDADNDRVIEVAPSPPDGGTIVWQYGTTGDAGTGQDQLDTPYDAQRLPNGATLIAEHGGGRVLIVAPAGVPYRLAITSPAQRLAADACSAALEFQVEANPGEAVNVPADTDLTPLGPGFRFFSDAACGSPITRVTVLAGTGSGRVYFSGGDAGLVSVRVAAPWLVPADQLETIDAADGGGNGGGGSVSLNVRCGCQAADGLLVFGAVLTICARVRRRQRRQFP